jgi:hypothetical protein
MCQKRIPHEVWNLLISLTPGPSERLRGNYPMPNNSESEYAIYQFLFHQELHSIWNRLP